MVTQIQNHNNHVTTHPFVNTDSLTEMSVDQLQMKITELNKKKIMAGNNDYLRSQLAMAIASYTEVYQRKISEQYQKFNLNNKIDINNSTKQNNNTVAVETYPIPPLPPHLT